MNFLTFVNSKDIRAHLEKIGYECSPLEAAWLVYQSKTATLEEKHAAWQEIIDTMPDCEIEWEHCTARGDSLHHFLRAYMALEREWLRSFYDNTNAVYRYKIRGKDSGLQLTGTSNVLFTTADKCLAAAKEEYGLLEIEVIYITKYITECIYDVKKYYWDMLKLNEKGEVRSVSHGIYGETERYYQCAFESLWFTFPTPFKKGDILWDPTHPEKDPIVVEETTPDYYARTGQKGGDSTDMNVWGTFQNEDGTIYNEVTDNYMNYEYYPLERLTGRRRILKALSNFLKDEIDVVLFARAYHQILLEEAAKDCIPRGYDDEGMRLAGLKEEK